LLQSAATVTITGQAQWNSATDASWNTAGSWADSISGTPIAAPGVRSIAGDTVLFATATGSTASLDGASPTLAGLTFDNTATSYTVSQGSSGSLILQAAGYATVSVISGNHAITAPLVLASGATLTTSAGTRLDLGGNISGAGGLTKSGGGIVRLSGSNSYAGNTVVTAGKLIVDNAAALPDGGNLTVGIGSFFTSPPISAPLAAARSQSTNAKTAFAAAVAAPAPARFPAPVARIASPPGRATSSAVSSARATALTQVAATTMQKRAAAAWILGSAAATDGPVDNRSKADMNTRIREAIFATYGRS
jgi:autotransporter-associated beta strand protein